MSADHLMHYPFSALVGQDQLRLALLLAAIDPRLGGVLVCGEKGTAKSTAARALAALFPPISVIAGCPFHCHPEAPWLDCPHCSTTENRTVTEIPLPLVNLPLGATEDRVLGSLELERALREGRKTLQPGLLAEAHRGILYIDEVNLLSDHLVDILLDAAAMGVNSVQREGIGLSHPARFIMIGTMNPEEGELRPQLLDRFGLMVQVTGPREPQLRAEVVRRRLAFEESPAEFAARWRAEQTALAERISTARQLLGKVVLDDERLGLITRLCCELEVDGLRGDIVLYKTARALAAYHDRTIVTEADVHTAADFALLHRRVARRTTPPAIRQTKPDSEQTGSAPHQPQPANNGADRQRSQDGHEQSSAAQGNREENDKEQNVPPESSADSNPTQIFPVPAAARVRPIEFDTSTTPPLNHLHPQRGRRNQAATTRDGHYVRATLAESPTDIAVDATLRAAALRGAWVDGRLTIEPTDLRQKQRVGRTGSTILFVVDASGSMAARRRMEAVKGAVLGLLLDAQQQRDRVAVIAVRGALSQLLLPPTRSLDLAERVLQTLPTGGRTPLAHALSLAGEVIDRERRSEPDGSLLLVLLTDGKANVCLPETSGDPFQQALAAAAQLATRRLAAMVLDTDNGFVRIGRADELASALAAEYLLLDELSAESLVEQVRQRRDVLI
jgi:magnesium chelatase subunit D